MHTGVLLLTGIGFITTELCYCSSHKIQLELNDGLVYLDENYENSFLHD